MPETIHEKRPSIKACQTSRKEKSFIGSIAADCANDTENPNRQDFIAISSGAGRSQEGIP